VKSAEKLTMKVNGKINELKVMKRLLFCVHVFFFRTLLPNIYQKRNIHVTCGKN